MYLFLLFFFYCSGDPRDLHSFPTRRSSDLSSRSPRERLCSCSNSRRLPRTSSTTSSSSMRDRKSTRLNSSHVSISYAVFCLKKKKKKKREIESQRKGAGVTAMILRSQVTER